MFIDEAIHAGTTTRVRVIAEEGDDTEQVGAFVLSSLWGGMGDYDEVVDLGDGAFEVICS